MNFFSMFVLAAMSLTCPLVAAEPVKQECHCKNCKCAPESNCGCFSEKGCHCGPACDGTNCAHQAETPAVTTENAPSEAKK